jgi:hypothetical protein
MDALLGVCEQRDLATTRQQRKEVMQNWEIVPQGSPVLIGTK